MLLKCWGKKRLVIFWWLYYAGPGWIVSATAPLIFSTSGSHQSLVGSWETWTHCAIWISNVEMIIIWMLTDPHIIHNWSIRPDRSRLHYLPGDLLTITLWVSHCRPQHARCEICNHYSWGYLHLAANITHILFPLDSSHQVVLMPALSPKQSAVTRYNTSTVWGWDGREGQLNLLHTYFQYDSPWEGHDRHLLS